MYIAFLTNIRYPVCMPGTGAGAFNKLYEQYFNRSVRFVRSYLFDDQAAEDIASECLIKVWEKMKTAELESVRSYLFVALKHRALDYLKHEGIRKAAADNIGARLNRELEIRISTLESLDPQDIFSTEIHRILYQTLEELPEKTRLIFMMSRFEGRSHKEIAERFNLTVKGVDYQLAKSLAALRISLKDYLPLLQLLVLLSQSKTN